MKFDPDDLTIDPFSDPSLRCSFVWEDRLSQSYAENLTPYQAVTRWRGAPEDPIGGYIPPDAVEAEVRSLAELYELTNPGGPPPPGVMIQDGLYPDGTPADRSQGWGSLGGYTRPMYPTFTDAAVRYVPVTAGGAVLGYLWASTAEDAAAYLPSEQAGKPGLVAAGWWRGRLGDWYESELAPTAALAASRQVPENAFGGVVTVDAPEHQAPSLAHLIDVAQRR
ncbi:hypothetical protein [Nocardia sp. NBC_00416]|uniref:hypothetical protein n=1 Tax=Nocardia sp. NBC_00416 TaxID=2975991 RepID=UPI002E23DDFE